MTDERLEKIMQESLPQINTNVAINQQILEKANCKKIHSISMKRIIVLVALCCLLFSSITVVAVGVKHYISIGSKEFFTEDYKMIDKIEKMAGFEFKFIKNFATKYSFESMSVSNSKIYLREEGEEDIYHADWKSVSINYSKEYGMGMICLGIWKAAEGEQAKIAGTDIINIAGVNVKYEDGMYKLSEEAKESIKKAVNEANIQNYKIPEETERRTVEWVQDGICYLIYGQPEYITRDELISIAEELITLE